MHHVEPALHPIPGDDVAQRVGLGVAHVEIARRVREHVEDVLLRTRIIRAPGPERGDLVPHRQPTRLDCVDVVDVLLTHDPSPLTTERPGFREWKTGRMCWWS